MAVLSSERDPGWLVQSPVLPAGAGRSILRVSVRHSMVGPRTASRPGISTRKSFPPAEQENAAFFGRETEDAFDRLTEAALWSSVDPNGDPFDGKIHA